MHWPLGPHSTGWCYVAIMGVHWLVRFSHTKPPTSKFCHVALPTSSAMRFTYNFKFARVSLSNAPLASSSWAELASMWSFGSKVPCHLRTSLCYIPLTLLLGLFTVDLVFHCCRKVINVCKIGILGLSTTCRLWIFVFFCL